MAGSGIGKREIARRQQRLRVSIGSQIVDLREEAGVSQAALARAAGVDNGHLSRIERGEAVASLDAVVAVGAALGAGVGVRLFPGSNPGIRDHLQAPIVEALVRVLDARWRPIPEFSVPAARGVIDLALRTRKGGRAIAVEVHSQLRSIDLVIRRLREKTLALGQIDGVGESSSLLVLRLTARNRELAQLHAATLAASFPGACREAIAGLTGADAEWPGPTILWARVERGRAEILDRPPRGVAVGR
jgi:transcriptional regulator with XRE-family HTH domain